MQLKLNCYQFKIGCFNCMVLCVSYSATARKIPTADTQKKEKGIKAYYCKKSQQHIKKDSKKGREGPKCYKTNRQ